MKGGPETEEVRIESCDDDDCCDLGREDDQSSVARDLYLREGASLEAEAEVA